MILSGREIKKRLNEDIFIDPYDERQLNPNSYNLRLADELYVYRSEILDMKIPNEAERIPIPAEGYLLRPGKLYLGRTFERTRTLNLVPMLEGRSSVGRLGLFVHVTAGFGDVGFNGFWTLELSCVQPIRIYAGVEIAQIFYHTIQGAVDLYKSEKYNNNEGIQPSLLYRDFASRG